MRLDNRSAAIDDEAVDGLRIQTLPGALPARTVAPSRNGYLLLAGEVDWRGPFASPGLAKRRLLAEAKTRCFTLTRRTGVLEATLFRAVFVAPGEGRERLAMRSERLHRARYDVVILIRTTDVAAARRLRGDPEYAALSAGVREVASHTLEVVARNAIRLGDVDHRPDHVFLFNYFVADDPSRLIPVFERTAGWFQRKTGLTNSTLLQPVDGEPGAHGIINHASWPGFGDFLPSLIFRPSFRSFVQATFAVNGIAAQPILYRRV